MQASTRPDALVDPATAAQVARLNFVAGGIQDANLPAHVMASVTVLTFRTARGAAASLRQDHPTALADLNTPGDVRRWAGRWRAGSTSPVPAPTVGRARRSPPASPLLPQRNVAVFVPRTIAATLAPFCLGCCKRMAFHAQS
jgi:hypothetical protein